jgi:hypothetical protein
MATRFDSFTLTECMILSGALAVFRDSYLALNQPKLINGPAPSRDALLTELSGATNYPGKTPDIETGGKIREGNRQ